MSCHLAAMVWGYRFSSAQILADNPLENLGRQADADRLAQLHERAVDHDRQIKKQEFVSKFSTKYKAEHVIDAKQVESIKKAYRNLERAEPWFKMDGSKTDDIIKADAVQ